MRKLAPAMRKLAPAMRKLAPAMRKLAPAMRKLAPAMRKLAPGMRKLAPAMRKLAPAMRKLAPGMRKLPLAPGELALALSVKSLVCRKLPLHPAPSSPPFCNSLTALGSSLSATRLASRYLRKRPFVVFHSPGSSFSSGCRKTTIAPVNTEKRKSRGIALVHIRV